MENYIDDVRYALQILIVIVWKERNELTFLNKEKNRIIQELKENKRIVEFLTQNPDLDDEGIGSFTYWLTSHSTVPDFNEKEKSILKLKDEIKNKQYSIDLLSSSILQIAKQGLIRVFGGLESCSNGRDINKLPLKEYLWYGRNQGIHFEEGSLNSKTKDFFNRLTNQIPDEFSNFQTRNMSFKILNALGWKTLSAIRKDMLGFTLVEDKTNIKNNEKA